MPTLSVSDAFDRGRRSARFLLAPLEPGEVARAAYRLPTDRRGRFEIGPLRATVGDPFGLASRTRRILGIEEVIVFPRVHDIMALPETGGDELDRDMPRAHGRLGPGRRVPEPARLRARRRPPAGALALDRAARSV